MNCPARACAHYPPAFTRRTMHGVRHTISCTHGMPALMYRTMHGVRHTIACVHRTMHGVRHTMHGVRHTISCTHGMPALMRRTMHGVRHTISCTHGMPALMRRTMNCVRRTITFTHRTMHCVRRTITFTHRTMHGVRHTIAYTHGMPALMYRTMNCVRRTITFTHRTMHGVRHTIAYTHGMPALMRRTMHGVRRTITFTHRTTTPAHYAALCTTAIVLCAATPALRAWDWPVKDPNVTHSFLSVQQDTHTHGVTLQSRSSARVQAAESGTIVFTATPVSRPHATRVPHVLGGMVIVEHHNGFRSIYSNSIPSRTSGTFVYKNEDIAEIDRNKENNELHFMVVDDSTHSFINPLLILPRLNDILRPSIYSYNIVFLQSPMLGQYFNVHVGTQDRRVFSTSITPTIPPFVSVRYHTHMQSIFLDSVTERAGYVYNESTARVPEDIFTDDMEFVLGPFPLQSDEETIEIQVTDYNLLTRTVRVPLYEEETP